MPILRLRRDTPQRRFLEALRVDVSSEGDEESLTCFPDAIQFDEGAKAEKLESVIRDILMCGFEDENATMFIEQGLLKQTVLPKIA